VGKYVSKPVKIEAVRWMRDNKLELIQFASEANLDFAENRPIKLWIHKSETWCQVRTGDWIIREPDGSGFYPCTNAVFMDRYEPAPIIERRRLEQEEV